MHETGRQRVKAFLFFLGRAISCSYTGTTGSDHIKVPNQTKAISDLGWEFTILGRHFGVCGVGVLVVVVVPRGGGGADCVRWWRRGGW